MNQLPITAGAGNGAMAILFQVVTGPKLSCHHLGATNN
jgi:hypothetical protein